MLLFMLFMPLPIALLINIQILGSSAMYAAGVIGIESVEAVPASRCIMYSETRSVCMVVLDFREIWFLAHFLLEVVLDASEALTRSETSVQNERLYSSKACSIWKRCE